MYMVGCIKFFEKSASVEWTEFRKNYKKTNISFQVIVGILMLPISYMLSPWSKYRVIVTCGSEATPYR